MRETMNLQEKKLELVQLIMDTEKPAILDKVEAVLKKEKDVDWWDELGDDQRKAIEQGIKEADNGDLKSHAEVPKERKGKYNLDQ